MPGSTRESSTTEVAPLAAATAEALRAFRRPAAIRLVLANHLARVGLAVVTVFLLCAIFAYWLAPHAPDTIVEDAKGNWQMMRPPSPAFLLGTTTAGRDVFSQVVYGSQIAFLVGVFSAVNVAIIGTMVGLLAGYFGGRVDEVLMRITDVVYGIPFLPFAIVLVAVLGSSFWNVIIAISVLLWRETARVIRAQVLSLRQRAFVESARVAGAGHARIIFVHIAPQVIPISVLYAVLAVGWAILTEASVSFLGFGDPNFTSWGRMLQDAYTSQALSQRLWWVVLPPGACIAALLLSTFFIGQGIEEVVNPRLRRG